MKKNILIVDDFENTLFVTGFTIEQAGYTIFKADSGKKALEILKSVEKIDLIISDYNMPQMNGLQFMKEVKKLPQAAHIPIFMLSTEANEEIISNAYESGITLWIRKPFKINELFAYIQKAIGK